MEENNSNNTGAEQPGGEQSKPDQIRNVIEEEKRKSRKRIIILVCIAIAVVIIFIIILFIFFLCSNRDISSEKPPETAAIAEVTEETGSDITEAADTSPETTAETTAETTTATTAAETPPAETPAEVVRIRPTISLALYDGPFFSPLDGVCYWRVKATVTGSAPVSITWNKDDSHRAFGQDIAQVNLSSPTETFTLVGTATNAAGSVSDSIFLSWGCEIPQTNRPPEVSQIQIRDRKNRQIVTSVYTNQQYEIFVTASDPDGDTLSYSWQVEGIFPGILENSTENPAIWRAPYSVATVMIKVAVDDGNSATVNRELEVEVYYY